MNPIFGSTRAIVLSTHRLLPLNKIHFLHIRRKGSVRKIQVDYT